MEMVAGKDFDYYTKVITEAMKGLIPAERGVYQYMKSQSKTWQFNVEYMSEEMNCTIYHVRKVLKKLISKGLVERIEKRVKGFLFYDYKVRDKQGEVRDDAKLMNRSKDKILEPTVVESVELVEVKQSKQETIKVEKKDWKVLFKGNERFIDKFIADRKVYLSNCDYYKTNLKRTATDLEAENHISKKLNTTDSDMELRIAEFIVTEIKKEKVKAERESSQIVSEYKKLEIEKKDKILAAKTNLFKERFPDHWAEKPTGMEMNREWMARKKLLEVTIKEELEAIEEKYNKEYKLLLEVVKR